MATTSPPQPQQKSFALFVTLYFLGVVFWIAVQFLDVYRFAVLGALYEILWLPMLFILFASPLLSFYFWFKTGFKTASKYFFLLLFQALLVVWLTFQ